MSCTTPRKVLLIGWDAADWKLINPLIDAGKMPALEALVNEGVMGSIATLHPVLSPMLWTSIATGKRPFKHGVLGFTEPLPNGGGVGPVSSLSRKVKAVWNILNQTGHTPIVVGWWPSHPVEPLNGAMVSNLYSQAVGPMDQPWPLLAGAVHPPRLADDLAALRFHPSELADVHILPFVPRAAEIDQEKDPRLAVLAKIVAEATTIQAAATWLMSHEPWDFMAVYFDSIDHFCHAFMKYHPPRRDFVPEHDYELYHGVVEAGYRYHDLMLHTLVSLAGHDTTIVLVSDHGFHPDHLRPRRVPHEPAGPAYEHRDFGIFVMKGPGIRRDEYVHGVSLLDVTPTVLTLFELPIGEDMDGRPVVEAFEKSPEVGMLPSWEDVPGAHGCHSADARLDPLASQEAIHQLVALGYIAPPDENRDHAVANTVRELRFNLARAYMDAGLHGAAVPLLQELSTDRLDDYRPAIQLAMCYRALGDIPAMSRLVSELSQRRQTQADLARARLKALVAELRLRSTERAGPPITSEERSTLRWLRRRASIPAYALEYLAGFVAAEEGRYEAALEHLSRADEAEPGRPGLHLQIGETYLKLKRWQEAERAFEKAAGLDADNPYARLGLCRSYLARRRNRAAAEEALAAIAQLYQYPLAHFCLGVAMSRLGDAPRAIEALQVAIALNPNFAEAHRRLAWIYRWRLADLARAEDHQRAAQQIRAAARTSRGQVPHFAAARPTVPAAAERTPLGFPAEDGRTSIITVVTGLPRSGTSMLMQMLSSGGLSVLSDGIRQADVDNPRGYFEYERAKSLRTDPSWLVDARGKAVKIVAQLVPYLSPDNRYAVIWIERDLVEVVASQRIMLARNGRQGAALSDAQLQAAFRAQLSFVKSWLREQPNLRTLFLRYPEVLADPAAVAAQINDFLGGGLATAAMAGAVDVSLSHQRATHG